MQEQALDAAVIGAGTAGLYALSRALHETDKALLFEGGHEGTMCARTGCMPSKALIAESLNEHVLALCPGAQRQADTARMLATVRERRDRLVERTARGAHMKFGSKIVNEMVRFVEPMVIQAGDTRYRCQSIVIATGSEPVVPPGWSVAHNKIVTTDTFFEQETIGPRVLVVGAGPVGIELGQALAQAGHTVSVVEMTRSVAGVKNPDVAQALKDALADTQGLSLGFSTRARLDKVADDVSVTLENTENGETFAHTFDLVLLASGRRPRLAPLAMENAGLELDDRGFPRFDPSTLKCAGQNVFLAGDVSALRPFYHDAADQGKLAGKNAVAKGDLHTLPNRVPLTVVFTRPMVASVGRTIDQLDPDETIVSTADPSKSGRAIVEGDKPGLLALYFNKSDRRIVGAEMAFPAAEHLGHLVAVFIQQRMTAEDILKMPFYHPTYEEMIQSATLGV